MYRSVLCELLPNPSTCRHLLGGSPCSKPVFWPTLANCSGRISCSARIKLVKLAGSSVGSLGSLGACLGSLLCLLLCLITRQAHHLPIQSTGKTGDLTWIGTFHYCRCTCTTTTITTYHRHPSIFVDCLPHFLNLTLPSHSPNPIPPRLRSRGGIFTETT